MWLRRNITKKPAAAPVLIRPLRGGRYPLCPLGIVASRPRRAARRRRIVRHGQATVHVRLRSEGVNASRDACLFLSDETCCERRREAPTASRITGEDDMRAQLILLAAGAVAVLAGVVAWVLNVSTFDRWLEIHTGVADSTSPYYAFWSGFGSDIAERSEERRVGKECR